MCPQSSNGGEVLSSGRPVSILCVGLLFVGIGTVSLTSCGWRFARDIAAADGPWTHGLVDSSYAAGSALVAILAGALVLRGREAGRWLCAAWLALHVVLSLLHDWFGFGVHLFLFIGIAVLLFRPHATAWFRHADGRAPPRRAEEV
jgi:hypothetical protein